MRFQLGKDLEVLPDGEYRLLRRKSSKLKPIYCFYSYKAGDALVDGQPTHTGKLQIRHDFDDRLYSGFSNDSKHNIMLAKPHWFTQLTLQPKPFLERIQCALALTQQQYKMGSVDYKLFSNETFFIEPTAEYDELFYKFPDYQYQYEGRILLQDVQFDCFTERYPLEIHPLDKSDYRKTFEPLYFEANFTVTRR